MFLKHELTFNSNHNKGIKPTANTHTSDEYYALVADILKTFSNIVRAAFIPQTFKQQSIDEDSEKSTKSLITPWPIQHDAKIISQILPHCLRVCRYKRLLKLRDFKDWLTIIIYNLFL